MRAKPLKTKGSRGLALLDIENLAGTPRLTEASARSIELEIARAYRFDPHDLIYVGGSPFNGLPCRVLADCLHGSVALQSGPDGADLALVDKARTLPDSAFNSDIRRIVKCVIGSGDHIFTEVAKEMKARGLRIIVISRRDALSRDLARAADRVIYLGESNIAALGRAA